MSRRIFLSLCVWLIWVAGGFAADKTTKILLIGKDRDHAYATHTYMDDCELLARCLRQTPGVETVVSNGWPKDPSVLKDVRAIVLQTRMGGNVLFGGPQRRQAEELLKQGVGLTAIHWSTGAEKDVGEKYLQTLGGWFNTDFSEYYVQLSKVTQVDPRHPICRGWEDYDLREEYYIKLRYMPESKPIMRARVKDKAGQTKDYDIGWTYERPDGGRSFGFVGGHFHSNFGEKPFRQAVVNGILWTARLEVPEGGAPCAIVAKDMELPARAADETSARPNTLTAKEIADGWIALFDGETTFGWKIEGEAKVKDGVLLLGGDKEAKATPTSMYRDWQLHVDSQGDGQLVLADGKGNSVSAGLSNQTLNLWATAGGALGTHIEVTAGPVNKAMFSYDGSYPVPLRFEVAAGKTLALSNVKLKPLGLKSIFNGKDLTGWKVIPGHKSEFGVNEKGELTIKNGNGDIQTEGEWDDFALQLDIFSNGPHLNSGVFFRCLPGQFWSGYEAQIRNEWITDVVLKDGTKLSGSYTAKGDEISLRVYKLEKGLYKATKEVRKLAKGDIAEVIDHRDKPIDFGTGAIYNRQPARKVVSNDYEWYTMTVVANGNHLAVWVNGYQTADFTDTRPPNKSARNGSKVEKGPLSLQGHDPTTDLSFRNIRIAELPRIRQ